MYRRNRDFARYLDRGLSRELGNYREILQLAAIFARGSSKKLGVLKTRIAKLRSSHQRNIIRLTEDLRRPQNRVRDSRAYRCHSVSPKAKRSDRRKTFVSWNACAARNSLGDDNWQIMAYNVGSEARQTNGN